MTPNYLIIFGQVMLGSFFFVHPYRRAWNRFNHLLTLGITLTKFEFMILAPTFCIQVINLLMEQTLFMSFEYNIHFAFSKFFLCKFIHDVTN